MPINRKQQLLGFLFFAFLLMVLLGVSLPMLQMEPGEIFSLQASDQPTFSSNRDPDNFSWFFVAIRGFQVILFILAFVYIVISLFDKKARRRLLSDLLKFALLTMLMLFLLDRGLPSSQPSDPESLQTGFLEPPEFSGEIVTPPNFEANPQPWILPMITIGAAVLLALVTFLVLNFLSKRKPVERPALSDIAVNAQNALDEIEEAKIDFNDVIIRCYAEMSQTLKAENGIQRDQTMTTREFEQDLLVRGFPARPVQQLTHLFEQVRYGRQRPGENDKQVATESLNEIIAFCRGQA